jgi:hypothetical protein
LVTLPEIKDDGDTIAPLTSAKIRAKEQEPVGNNSLAAFSPSGAWMLVKLIPTVPDPHTPHFTVFLQFII